jgi:aryl-alcohol dehydrogenase-like predicted oxidoreductase
MNSQTTITPEAIEMGLVRLGMTNLRVTPIAYGTWQFGGEWGAVDEPAAIEAIRRAYDLGINFFDTAQAYGFGISERILGDALAPELRGRRDDIVIATKGGLRLDADRGLVRDSSPGWLRRGVEASLENLGITHIDLYQVHWPDSDVPFAETAGALQELVDEGLIRHVGVSNYTVEQIADFGRTRPVETVQPPYHLFRREIEDGLLPYAEGNDIGVLAYGPLAHGLLGGTMDEGTTFPDDDWRRSSPLFKGDDFRRNLAAVARLKSFAEERDARVSQLAIAWMLAQPAVDVAIVGARGLGHLEESATAAEIELSAEDLGEIERIMADSVQVAGPSPEAAPA